MHFHPDNVPERVQPEIESSEPFDEVDLPHFPWSGTIGAAFDEKDLFMVIVGIAHDFAVGRGAKVAFETDIAVWQSDNLRAVEFPDIEALHGGKGLEVSICAHTKKRTRKQSSQTGLASLPRQTAPRPKMPQYIKMQGHTSSRQFLILR